MDKKQFFESFISVLPDNSWHRLDSFPKIREFLTSLRLNIGDESLRSEFDQVAKEVLFHVWMLEQVCNGEVLRRGNDTDVTGPVIVISVFSEILFANKAYCKLTGLTPEEIKSYSQDGTLYDRVYKWNDVYQASEAVSRLQAGKWYKQLELILKHSGRKIAWNSYGGVGESLEIRSGRATTEENDQKKERERFYRGSLMNTGRLMQNLYQISIHGTLSLEQEQRLMWIQEFLSMFDFLWNHSEFFMEIIDMPTEKTGKIYGYYNTVYSQFLKRSWSDVKKFKDILTIAHGETILKFLETRDFKNSPSMGEHTFHDFGKHPIARVHWQYSEYRNDILPEHYKMFSIGVLTAKIQKKNIFIHIFESLLRR